MASERLEPAGQAADLRGVASMMARSTPISAGVLTRVAEDLETGGPIGRFLSAHPESGTPLFALRALAGVRLLVLRGEASELAEHLERLGDGLDGNTCDARTWDLFRTTVLGNRSRLSEALDRPVQQHHPRRAAHLLEGLAMLAEPGARIRLLEIGACAGVHLQFDRYRWFGPDWQWGEIGSPVCLPSAGRYPGRFEIIDRAGCDPVPRDASDPDDVLLLRSFVPHEAVVDELDLMEALRLAAESGDRVEQADAVAWLDRQLLRPPPGPAPTTVVWHSKFWWSLSDERRRQIEELLREAATSGPLARVCYEPPATSARPRLQVTVY